MIRTANPADLETIWQLYQRIILDIAQVNDPSYAALVQKQGFIVSDSTKEEIASRIITSTTFNVFERENKVTGFIDINKEIYFPEEAANILWLSNELKQEYFHGDKSTVLHLITVENNVRGMGIAESLLNDAQDQLRHKGIKYIFSIVTTGPLTNCPSVIWHTKMGFKRVCVTYPIDLFGLSNYSSLLFYKEI